MKQYTQNELKDMFRKDALKLYQQHKEDLLRVDLSECKSLYLIVPIEFALRLWYAKFDITEKKLISIGSNHIQERIIYKKRFLRKPKKIIETYITEVSYEVSKLEWLLQNEYLSYEKQ